jgi:hypothetical protein
MLQYIEALKLEVFTSEDVVKTYTKESYNNTYYQGFVDRLCSVLLKNGYLSATYISTGRKTVARYTYIKREFNN